VLMPLKCFDFDFGSCLFALEIFCFRRRTRNEVINKTKTRLTETSEHRMGSEGGVGGVLCIALSTSPKYEIRDLSFLNRDIYLSCKRATCRRSLDRYLDRTCLLVVSQGDLRMASIDSTGQAGCPERIVIGSKAIRECFVARRSFHLAHSA